MQKNSGSKSPKRHPHYLMKLPYSYYVRIRVPLDIRHKFCNKPELRFCLKTCNKVDAESKARMAAGTVQRFFRNIRNNGILAMLTDEQIVKIVNDHIECSLKEDLDGRLENPTFYYGRYNNEEPVEETLADGTTQYITQGEWLRNCKAHELEVESGKCRYQLQTYDFSEVSKKANWLLENVVEAGEIDKADVPKEGSKLFNRVCQEMLKGYIHFFQVLADRTLGKHLENLNEIQSYSTGNEQTTTPPSPVLTPPGHQRPTRLVTMGELAERYWQERSSQWC